MLLDEVDYMTRTTSTWSIVMWLPITLCHYMSVISICVALVLL